MMATLGYDEITSVDKRYAQLTNAQYVRLARVISSDNMESIALGYLSIEKETIRNLRYENRDNAEAFNRNVLEKWANMNPGPDQVKVGMYL